MKKFTFALLAIVVSVGVHAQIKHNKFATRIKFDQFNASTFWQTEVSEIKDNSGYFLSNRKDNSGQVSPSLVKLDVDGNIVFDTIYDFLPNNIGGFINIQNTVTTITNHTMLFSTGYLQAQNSLAAPYIINLDTAGAINWHGGFAHDTLDLEAKKIIPTQDGGYLICGTLYDWMNGVYVPSGFAIKVNNVGVLQWQNFYADKDSMEIHFRDGIETPDGGFLYVGDAPNFIGGAKPPVPGNMDILIDFVRTDNLGNVVWSKAMNLDFPIDPQYGFGDFSIAMLDDTNAFVSYSVYDTTSGGNNKFAITSINVNNGSNNWTKIYSLAAGGDISIRKAMASFKGEIIVSASDYSGNGTGVIFMLDENGNYTQSKRFTYWNYANFPYNTINTLDGGFVHLSEVDNDEVLVVKTDQLFDPSCANIDSSYGGLTSALIADSSFFGAVDTTYMLGNLNPVQLALGSPLATSADDSTICSCSNTIAGMVFTGVSAPVSNAKVYLFKKGAIPTPWAPIDSVVSDAGGNYQFNYVPTDSFIVRVTPDPLLNPGAMTSYFKEPIWCYRWDSAGVFHAHCDSGTVQKDVKLVVPAPLTGNSSLNGYIYEYTGSFSKQPGDPVPGIDITVEQSPGGIVGAATSGSGGYYDLSNINNGATYVISVDFPGLTHDSIYTMQVNLNDTTLDSLNFYVDSTGIYILAQPLGTGVNSALETNISLELYPNPSVGPFHLNVNAIKPTDVLLEISNELGQVVSSEHKNLKQGVNTIRLNTDELPSGIYFVTAKEKGQLFVRKLIKL